MNSTNVTGGASNGNSLATLANYSFYVVIGSFATLGNLLVIVTILRQKVLQDRFILQAALAGGDFITGLAYFVSGAMRIHYWLNNLLSSTASQIDCMLRPYFPFFIAGHQIAAIMEVLIAIDRLIAISFPMYYFTLPKRKVSAIAWTIGYGYCAISLGVAYAIVAFSQNRQVAYTCTGTDTYGQIYNVYNYGLAVVGGGVSTGILSATVCILKRQNKNLEGNTVAKQRLAKQAKLTKMMIFISAIMVVFYVLPSAGIIAYGAINIPSITAIASPSFGNLLSFHAALNVLVYAVLSTELRDEFKATLCLILPRNWRPKDNKVGTGSIVGTIGKTATTRARVGMSVQPLPTVG